MTSSATEMVGRGYFTVGISNDYIVTFDVGPDGNHYAYLCTYFGTKIDQTKPYSSIKEIMSDAFGIVDMFDLIVTDNQREEDAYYKSRENIEDALL